MSIPFIIRPAVEKDFPAISALYRETYQLHHQAHPDSYKETPEYPLARGTFLNLLEDEDEAILVAEVDGMVIGMMNISIEEEGESRLHHPYRRVVVDELSVTQDWRRKGVGRAFLQQAEKWAKEKETRQLTVIVYNFNQEALAFYESQGYTPFSVRLSKRI